VLVLAGGRRPATLDLVALTIPIPWMAAKLGCFLNGCCHGRPCSLPWAVTFPPGARTAPPGVPIHPSQLYEVVPSDESLGYRLSPSGLGLLPSASAFIPPFICGFLLREEFLRHFGFLRQHGGVEKRLIMVKL
jgi:hypothetical protein